MSNSLIQLALDELKCTQSELAKKLKVSEAQISKWKNNDYMSLDMDASLRKLAKIGKLDPDFILLCGSKEDAKKWEKLITFLANYAADVSEYTGLERLRFDYENLCGRVFDIFEKIGVATPIAFPRELEIGRKYESLDPEKDYLIFETLTEKNPHSAFIYKLFTAYCDIDIFYRVFIGNIEFEYDDLAYLADDELEFCLIDLAATKLSVSKEFAPKFDSFVMETESDCTKWIRTIKQYVFDSGKPMKAEFMDLIKNSTNDLSVQIEIEDYGSKPLHPDIYMNELLSSTRKINALMPLILKKLGISEDEVREAMKANGIY